MSGRTGKGKSSWVGFWNRSDRGMAWLQVATTYRDAFNANIWAANLLNTPESQQAMRHLRKMCAWALKRAERYGTDMIRKELIARRAGKPFSQLPIKQDMAL